MLGQMQLMTPNNNLPIRYNHTTMYISISHLSDINSCNLMDCTDAQNTVQGLIVSSCVTWELCNQNLVYSLTLPTEVKCQQNYGQCYLCLLAKTQHNI